MSVHRREKPKVCRCGTSQLMIDVILKKTGMCGDAALSDLPVVYSGDWVQTQVTGYRPRCLGRQFVYGYNFCVGNIQ